MFAWNDKDKVKKSDEEIAFDITDCLFAGKDAKTVEALLVKEFRARRIDTVEWLIAECEDKILEEKINNPNGEVVVKLRNLRLGLEHLKSDIEKGYVPYPFPLFSHKEDESFYVVPLIWGIISVWGIFWLLRG